MNTSSEALRVGPQDGPAPGRSRQQNVSDSNPHSSAAEEMERFRPVPVMGRLPWHAQYRILAAVLLAGLLALAAATVGLYAALGSDQAQRQSQVVLLHSLLDVDGALGQVVAGDPNAARSMEEALRNGNAAMSRWSGGNGDWQQRWSAIDQRAAPVRQAIGKFAGTDPRMLTAVSALRQELGSLSDQLRAAPTQAASLSSRLALLAGAVAWVIVAMALLLWVHWKQQRYQTLSAQAQTERVQSSIMGLMEHMRLLAEGDLTRKAPVSEDEVGTLADIINTAMESLRDLVRAYKQSSERTSEAVRQASDTTGMLVDRAREDLSNQAAHGAEVLRLAQGVRQLARLADAVSGASAQAREAVVSGSDAVSQAQGRIGEIRQMNEEAGTRVDRLASSSREIASIATMLHALADQTGVLADQAALQSARAGEHGQGFRIVASGMNDLAQQIGDNARKVGTLVETALGDIEMARVSMSNAVSGTDEASRLIDMSNDAGRLAVDRTGELEKSVKQMAEVVPEQERIAGVLDANTKNALARNEEGQQRAHQAAEGIMALYDIVQALRASSDRFKV